MKKTVKAAMVLVAVCFAMVLSGPARADQAAGLKKTLVDLPGWQAEAAEGASIDMGGISMVNASRSYSSGGKTLDATIIVGTSAMVQGQVQSVNVQTAEASVTTAVHDGFTAVNSYDKKEKSGGIVVSLLKKEPNGAMLAVSYAGMTPEAAMEVVKKFDWKKMKQAAAAVLK